MPLTLEHGHSPEEIQARLAQGHSASYLRDWIYGGIDGAITTFAIVSGVTGAQLSPSTILILGLANVLADGFSMAAANYLGTRAERDERNRFEAHERRQIHLDPKGEREEIRQILIRKGFDGPMLESAVEALTADKERWIRMMLAEEYGMPSAIRSPMKAALATFSAFVACGAVPLIPYILSFERTFSIAAMATAAVFFAIGSLKSRWSIQPWWRSGMETLLIGGSAAAMAFGVGRLFAENS